MAINYPGYQRFSRVRRKFSVFAEGRHIFDRGPKPRAAKERENKDLTEAGNRARKVSGTQGSHKSARKPHKKEETHNLSKVSQFLLKSLYIRGLQKQLFFSHKILIFWTLRSIVDGHNSTLGYMWLF